ncbi:hypothetical protein [Snuella lapsa]|uniref:Uncharacterized protein n=1 Tax=Snuella lapsa TaxID=870481 RepID=A0ABP6YBU7_9FLAO
MKKIKNFIENSFKTENMLCVNAYDEDLGDMLCNDILGYLISQVLNKSDKVMIVTDESLLDEHIEQQYYSHPNLNKEIIENHLIIEDVNKFGAKKVKIDKLAKYVTKHNIKVIHFHCFLNSRLNYDKLQLFLKAHGILGLLHTGYEMHSFLCPFDISILGTHKPKHYLFKFRTNSNPISYTEHFLKYKPINYNFSKCLKVVQSKKIAE